MLVPWRVGKYASTTFECLGFQEIVVKPKIGED